MEHIWLFSHSAVTVAAVDFLDPAIETEPDARERGVRLEVRPVSARRAGSIYASQPLEVHPAVVRVDLLESSPHAADRMHWHPRMHDGEPGDRTYDHQLGRDPRGWLRGFFARLSDGGLEGFQPDVATSVRGDEQAIAAATDDIVDRVLRLLDESRRPWPDVSHDERGLAIA